MRKLMPAFLLALDLFLCYQIYRYRAAVLHLAESIVSTFVDDSRDQ